MYKAYKPNNAPLCNTDMVACFQYPESSMTGRYQKASFKLNCRRLGMPCTRGPRAQKKPWSLHTVLMRKQVSPSERKAHPYSILSIDHVIVFLKCILIVFESESTMKVEQHHTQKKLNFKDKNLWNSHWCLIRTHHNYPLNKTNLFYKAINNLAYRPV